MRYEKLAKDIKNATPDNRLVKINLTNKDIEHLKSAGQIALAIIGTLSVATIAVAAPNLLTALDKLGKFTNNKQRWNHKEKQKKITQVFYYLKKTGQITIKPEQTSLKILLTGKGRKNLEKISFQSLKIPMQKKWNGRWWLVAADIPTKEYRLYADYFRRKIKQMGFYPLQKTLWIYSYNPAEQIEFTANHFHIGRFVTVMEINRLDTDDEKKLKKFFKL
ncbi:MAG: hypothetical protein M1383_00300 [Patescibacteria group bacterium]|nr:hypothetical protein [Patescibacteria group bacterium]